MPQPARAEPNGVTMEVSSATRTDGDGAAETPCLSWASLGPVSPFRIRQSPFLLPLKCLRVRSPDLSRNAGCPRSAYTQSVTLLGSTNPGLSYVQHIGSCLGQLLRGNRFAGDARLGCCFGWDCYRLLILPLGSPLGNPTISCPPP